MPCVLRPCHSCSKQLADLQTRQTFLERYIRRRLPVDLRGVHLLSSYDFPSGGAAAVLAAERWAKQLVFSSVTSLLVRLEQLLMAWGEALQGSTANSGRAGGASVSSAAEGKGSRKSREEKQGADQSARRRASLTGTRGPDDISAAGLVAVGNEKSERLPYGAPRGGAGGSCPRGPGNAAVSGIHFKLTVANGKALDALVEARKNIREVLQTLVRHALEALPSFAEEDSLECPGHLRKTLFPGNGRGAILEGNIGNQAKQNRGAAAALAEGGLFSFNFADGQLCFEGGEGSTDHWGPVVRRSLRQLGTAFRRFTTYSLVSLTLETDAFPILDDAQQGYAQSCAGPDIFSVHQDTGWPRDCPGGETQERVKAGAQAGDARRSTAAFMEASRRFDKCLSLLLRVAELWLEARRYQFPRLMASRNHASCLHDSAREAAFDSTAELPAPEMRSGRSPRRGTQIRSHEGPPENAERWQQRLDFSSQPPYGESPLYHFPSRESLPVPLSSKRKAEETPFCSLRLVASSSPSPSAPQHMVQDLSSLSSEHFRLLSRRILHGQRSGPSTGGGSCEAETALQECWQENCGVPSSRLGRSAASARVASVKQTRYSAAVLDREKKESTRPGGTRATVSAAAERSAVARAAAVCAATLDATNQMLQQVFLRHLDEAMVCMGECTIQGSDFLFSPNASRFVS